MGMAIEHVNKLLSVITATITEDDDCFTIEDENLQVFKEALLIAIETMRKYQKILEILNSASYTENGTEYSYTYDEDSRVKHIREVAEDGKID